MMKFRVNFAPAAVEAKTPSTGRERIAKHSNINNKIKIAKLVSAIMRIFLWRVRLARALGEPNAKIREIRIFERGVKSARGSKSIRRRSLKPKTDRRTETTAPILDFDRTDRGRSIRAHVERADIE